MGSVCDLITMGNCVSSVDNVQEIDEKVQRDSVDVRCNGSAGLLCIVPDVSCISGQSCVCMFVTSDSDSGYCRLVLVGDKLLSDKVDCSRPIFNQTESHGVSLGIGSGLLHRVSASETLTANCVALTADFRPCATVLLVDNLKTANKWRVHCSDNELVTECDLVKWTAQAYGLTEDTTCRHDCLFRGFQSGVKICQGLNSFENVDCLGGCLIQRSLGFVFDRGK